MFRLDSEDFKKVFATIRDNEKMTGFFVEVQQMSPEFYVKIWEISSDFLFLESDHSAHEEYSLWQSFMIHVCWIFKALKLCSGIIPSGVSGIYDEIVSTSDIFDRDEIAKRASLLGTINQDWITSSMNVSAKTGFCEVHGLGSIYALAEAYMEAYKRNEEDEAQKEISARETEDIRNKLRDSNVLDFIESLDIDFLSEEKS